MGTIVRVLASIGLFAIVGYVLLMGTLRTSLPQNEGEILLDGLAGPVTVARDAMGVPHISAASDLDLHRAMGYVHAQDRLFQMDINRRIGHGRMAEVLGSAGLNFDRYFRTIGFTEVAESAWDSLPQAGKDALVAYTEGVNAYLKTSNRALPPEFKILDYRPEPWTPIDTLVWQKMIWLDLSGNARTEAARAQLLTKLTSDQIKTLYPDYPGEDHGPLPDLSTIYQDSPIKEVAAALGQPKPDGYGSNNWVVSGAHTKTGKPLLANDPHLGLTTPSLWYLVRLHNSTDNTNAVGVGFPGSPGVVLGRNDNIAWGFTNTAPDIQDLFIEKLVGDNQYLTPDGPKDFEIREERIKVRFGKDETLRVRITRHGPVVSDIGATQGFEDMLRDDHVIAMQWTALMPDDTGLIGLMNIMAAKDFASFKAAGRDYFGPEQNMIYADTKGNIGYYAPARVPVRHPDNEIKGRFPSPGWDAKYDWQGFIDYDELPTRYNPEGGVIATANEKIVDDEYPHFITRDWSLPYRGNRIRAQLAEKAPHDLASFTDLHNDQVSDVAREIVPLLLEALPDGHPAHYVLQDWDGTMATDSKAALIYARWMHYYQRALVQDDIPDDLYWLVAYVKPRIIKSSLFHALGKSDGDETAYYALPALDKAATLAWCDSRKTDDVVETCLDIARLSMDLTIDDLAQEGLKVWGDAHILDQSHRPFSSIPPLADMFGLKAPVGGSRFTVNVAGDGVWWNNRHSSNFGPSYRGIFDMSDPDKSLFVMPTGQSAHPFSKHHSDFFNLWLEGRYTTIPTDKAVPDGASVLTLAPVQ